MIINDGLVDIIPSEERFLMYPIDFFIFVSLGYLEVTSSAIILSWLFNKYNISVIDAPIETILSCLAASIQDAILWACVVLIIR